MSAAVDYIEHAARMTRQVVLDAGPGGQPAPDAEFYTTLAKALDQTAQALRQLEKRRD